MTDLLSPKAKLVRLTAGDIRVAMSKRWTNPEYAIMWEVGEGTGAIRGRYADAIIMSLWPSRGLELHGVEIKVSRSDWRREAADPAKAEAIARYCDRWWIHTPPGIVDDLSGLPPAWGLREFDGKTWKTIREAAKTDADPVTRSFLAAMLRRADGMMRAMVTEAAREGRQTVEQEIQKARDGFADRLTKEVERKTADLENSSKNIALFEAAFGIVTAHNWSVDFPQLGKAARALCDCKNGYGNLSERLRKAADEIDAITGLSLVAPADPTE